MQAPDEFLKEVSIIVCTAGRSEALEACLGSLEGFQARGAQVVVVNNRPVDHALREMGARHEVRVVEEPRRGLGRARNAGIRASRGALLAFIDDDAQADGRKHSLTLSAKPSTACTVPSCRNHGSFSMLHVTSIPFPSA
jgi:glycosyltransferase involved in cell wall biosynthesis